jgi:hypothetical protein
VRQMAALDGPELAGLGLAGLAVLLAVVNGYSKAYSP